MRLTIRFLGMLAIAAFAGCSSNPLDPTAEPSRIALAQDKFTAPISVAIPQDKSAIVGMLERLHGPQDDDRLNSDLNWCYGNQAGMPYLEVKNFDANSQGIGAFLTRVGYATVKSYKIELIRNQVTGSNPDGSPHIWTYPIEPRTYECYVLNEKIAPYLGSSPNFHRGGTITLGNRIFSKWSFQNSYQTDIPGKGNVKIFAGTFEYSIASALPGLSFSGSGTATVKLWLDPDTGHWVIEDWKYQTSPAMAFAQSVEDTPAVKLSAAIKSNDWETVEKLVESGADPNTADDQGRTLVMRASVSPKAAEVIEFLLNQGAEVDRANKLGQTALHEAARGGQLPIVALLVSHGANVNAADGDGMTPIEYTMHGMPTYDFLKSHGATAELLPNFWGADQDGPGAYGSSVAALFKQQSLPPWLRELVDSGVAVGGDGRVVTLDGTKYEYFSFCRPHNCTSDMLYLLFSRGGSQVWVLSQEDRTKLRYFGDPSPAMQSFLVGRAREFQAPDIAFVFNAPSVVPLPAAATGVSTKVTVLEYFDFECPFSAQAKNLVHQLIDLYPKDVTFAFAHFPLSFHPNAMPAAKAAVAAEKQGKFLAMYDLLFENQKSLSRAKYVALAQSLGLQIPQFEEDMDSPDTESRILTDMKKAGNYRVGGTPSFIINGKLQTARSLELYRAAIDAELARAR